MQFEDSSGRQSGLHFQVADITNALVSVANLCDAGNVVVFGKQGGLIHHLQTGHRIRLPREGNAFYLDMKVAVEPEEEKKRVPGAVVGSTAGSWGSPAFRRPE